MGPAEGDVGGRQAAAEMKKRETNTAETEALANAGLR
jgi:hypothetical protein